MYKRQLFVGFSLRDGNFHRAVDDVRRALSKNKRKRLGTALFLAPSALTAELWQSELDILHFQESETCEPFPGPGNVSSAARKLEIFMDCLLGHCGSTTDHLLDPTFSHLLTKPEVDLKRALLSLERGLAIDSKSTAAWAKVEELLHTLGWAEEKNPGD